MVSKKSSDQPGISKRIAAIRKHLGLNQKDFALKTGCHRNRISHIERGLCKVPKSMLYALCTVLKVNLNWLVLGTGPMFQNEKTQGQLVHKSAIRIELLKEIMSEKEELLNEKDKRIALLEEIFDRQQ